MQPTRGYRWQQLASASTRLNHAAGGAISAAATGRSVAAASGRTQGQPRGRFDGAPSTRWPSRLLANPAGGTGQPAQFEPVPMNQGPVINQPAYGEMRETSPAVAPREMTPKKSSSRWRARYLPRRL